MTSIKQYYALLDQKDNWFISKKVILQDEKLQVLGFWARLKMILTTGSKNRRKQNEETCKAFQKAFNDEFSMLYHVPNNTLQSRLQKGQALRLRDVYSLLTSQRSYDKSGDNTKLHNILPIQNESANKQMLNTPDIPASNSNPPLNSGTKNNLPVSAGKTSDIASAVKNAPISSSAYQKKDQHKRKISAAIEEPRRLKLDSFLKEIFGDKKTCQKGIKKITDKFDMTIFQVFNIYNCTLEDSMPKSAQTIFAPYSKKEINNALKYPNRFPAINTMIQSAKNGLSKLPDYNGKLYVTVDNDQRSHNPSHNPEEFRIITSAKPSNEKNKCTLVYNMQGSVCKDISSFYENRNQIKTYLVMPNAKYHQTSESGHLKPKTADRGNVNSDVTIEYVVKNSIS